MNLSDRNRGGAFNHIRRLFLNIISVVVMAFLAAGCTQNDGRIGPLFGIWALDIAVDAASSQPIPLPEGKELTWSFQSDVVCMKVLGSYHTRSEYWGSWTLDSDRLTLDYNQSDNEYSPGHSAYDLPQGWGFADAPTTLVFDVRTLTGSRLTVHYVNPATGAELIYSFRKIP